MILFVLDACGLARIYFNDVGTRNLLQIYHYPQSRMVAPNLAHCEVLSTMISAQNNRVIDKAQYQAARHSFEGDLKGGKITVFNVSSELVHLARDLICKHKIEPGKMGLGGADSIYLATAVTLAESVQDVGGRVMVVTSDKALYKAAMDEPGVEAFHFWTCDMGCGCGPLIPVKGRPFTPNTCPKCGRVCEECRYDVCPSMYRVAF